MLTAQTLIHDLACSLNIFIDNNFRFMQDRKLLTEITFSSEMQTCHYSVKATMHKHV